MTYWNEQKKSECFRLGRHSKCFCGHPMDAHNDKYFGKKFDTACQGCPCKKFKFVPTRPEECGMYWLVRRKDFNVNTWRPPCKYSPSHLGASILQKTTPPTTLSNVRNAPATTSTLILPVSLAMGYGNTMRSSMKPQTSAPC